MSPSKYVPNEILNRFGADVNNSPCCRCTSLVCSAPGAENLMKIFLPYTPKK